MTNPIGAMTSAASQPYENDFETSGNARAVASDGDSSYSVATGTSLADVVSGTSQTRALDTLPPDRQLAKERLLQYVGEIPDAPSNLTEAHPALKTALAGIKFDQNAWYLGSPNASRVIVVLTGAPVDANYLVPFFERVKTRLNDSGTAFLLLPSAEPRKIAKAVDALKSVQPIDRIGFFTHSGGSITVHRMQNMGLLPPETESFAAEAWVEGGTYQPRPDASYEPEKLGWEPSDLPQNRGIAGYKKQLAALSRYYFPEDLWNDPECRAALLQVIDKMRFVGMGPLFSELFYMAFHGRSDKALVALQNSDIKILAFSGLDEQVVMPMHSEQAFATAIGKTVSAIPDAEFWTDGENVWAPLPNTRHMPMFEMADEMAGIYADFLGS
jgi:hypothetical protein